MSKDHAKLFSCFKPIKYTIQIKADVIHLLIIGQKQSPPSRRVSLHQKGLKVTSAKITRFDKHGPVEIDITRINHLPTFEQVRLHSQSIMYPGRYQIELEYILKTEKQTLLGNAKPTRELLPSIDEPEAWQSVELEVIR